MKFNRVLLIDDDEDDRELFGEAIKEVKSSPVVTVIDNAVDALRKLISKEIIADLIFLDLNMPMMRGDEFLTLIKQHERLKEIPVIVLTTSSGEQVEKMVKGLGAREFVTKPPSFEGLVTILESFLK